MSSGLVPGKGVEGVELRLDSCHGLSRLLDPDADGSVLLARDGVVDDLAP